MCGIVGFLEKRGGTDRPVGQTILTLLQALSCRGPDSAGVALFDTQDEWRVWVSGPAGHNPDAAAAALCELGVVGPRHYLTGGDDALLGSGADVSPPRGRSRHPLPGPQGMR